MKASPRDRALRAAGRLCRRLGPEAAWSRAERGAQASRGAQRRFWKTVAWAARIDALAEARPDTATRMWLAAEGDPWR